MVRGRSGARAAVVAALWFLTSAAGAAKPPVAVLDFKANNAAAGDATVMAGFVRRALVRTGAFKVTAEDRMRRILLSEQAFQQTGCTESSCAVKLGKLLSVRKVVTGEYAVLEGTRFLSVMLVDVETGEIERTAEVKGFEIRDADEAAKRLVADLTGTAPPAAAAPAPPTAVPPPRASKPGEITGADGAAMVLVPAGEFTMGSNDDAYDYEKSEHRVSISAFYLDTCEVTNTLYAAFLNEFGRYTDTDGQRMVYESDWGLRRVNGRWESQPGYELNPVVAVTWAGAAAYAKYWGKRLPTEAEWEYACRAGGTGKWCFGDDEGRLSEYAWYSANSGNQTHPVGQKAANAWGLFDMHGNVWEWCADWYDANYYAASPAQDPTGAVSGQTRVLRGGSSVDVATWCRSADRGRLDSLDQVLSPVGFRCASSARAR